MCAGFLFAGQGQLQIGGHNSLCGWRRQFETLNTQLSQTQFTVVGFCNLPQYIDLNRGTGNVGSGEIDGFVLVPDSVFTVAAFTEARILLSDAIPLDCFSQDYDLLCQQATQQIEVLAQTACQRRYDEILAQFGGFCHLLCNLKCRNGTLWEEKRWFPASTSKTTHSVSAIWENCYR